jgi:hypothetical protein
LTATKAQTKLGESLVANLKQKENLRIPDDESPGN